MKQSSSDRTDLTGVFTGIAARETVREVASILGRSGIAVVPLKGALLHATIYADSRKRPLVDVDVLVPPDQRERAVELLRKNGWRVAASGTSTDMLLKSDRPLPLDLHSRLYPTERFGPDSEQMIARARADKEIFGVEVRIPLPQDTYAHLVGHFAKDRRDERQMHSLVDLRELAARHCLDPDFVAHHLDENGLGRAARYTLLLARDHAADEFAGAVLGRLRPDPLGDRLSRCALAAVRRAEQPSKLAAIPVALLDRSLPDSALALCHHAAMAAYRGTKRRLRRHRA